MKGSWKYSLGVIVSVLALCFVVITFMLVQSTLFVGIFTTTPSHQLTSDDVLAAAIQKLPDPLVTVVPKDQQSPDQKTKVFISTEDPLTGNPSAQVFVILYGSTTDPEMQSYLAIVDALQTKYDTKIAIVWKDYTADDFAQTVAVAGHCANDSGKYWEFAQAVADRSADTTEALLTVGKSVGVNSLDMQDCIEQKGFLAEVQHSYYTGQQLRVTSTHALFINDRLYNAPISQAEVEQSIDEILASY